MLHDPRVCDGSYAFVVEARNSSLAHICARSADVLVSCHVGVTSPSWVGDQSFGAYEIQGTTFEPVEAPPGL